MTHLRPYLLVAIGAAIGANCRFLLASSAATRWGASFPYGTLIINVSGSFAIGLVMALLAQRSLVDPTWRLLLVTGFLGAYTPFSSFTYESLMLARDGGYATALLNLAGSVVAGMVAVTIGVLVGSR